MPCISSASATSASGVYISLQLLQIFRTRRCARQALTAPPMRNGSTPMLIRRVMDDGASLVWSVESTRWPVSDAWIAVLAVSKSRISPTMMTSGSCRSSARSAAAKDMPIFSFTGV